MGIALWADPIKRCEERGGTFHIAGRWCEEAPETPRNVTASRFG
jgi:hypothetical protein